MGGMRLREWKLAPIWIFTLTTLWVNPEWSETPASHVYLISVFCLLFVGILISAISVVRHAEALADHLGDPFGTLILTLSVIVMEVSIIMAVMLTGNDQPTLARDTVYAVIMTVINGLAGLALIVGGMRHSEQSYNLQGANSFLAVIIPLSILALVLPDFTHATSQPTFAPGQAVIVGVATLSLYSIFLGLQTTRHRAYFNHEAVRYDEEGERLIAAVNHPLLHHSLMLLAYLTPVVILAESLAVPIEHGINDWGLPVALGAILIASLVLSPEALGAISAARENRLQRATNILLGSVTATIGLTVPAVLIIGLLIGEPVILGLTDEQTLMLVLTLAVAMITYGSGRTNVLLGAVHLLLFVIYLMLLFDGR